MKRLLSVLLTLALLLTLAACAISRGSDRMPEDENNIAGETPALAPPVVKPAPEPPQQSFPGKIAIITAAIDQEEDKYRSGQQLVKKYGEDKIIHVNWPSSFMGETELMTSIVTRLAADPDVKALVLNPAIPYTNVAVEELLELREDIFIVYCSPSYYSPSYYGSSNHTVINAENAAGSAQRANLILAADELGMAPAMVEQAQKMGAKTFVHYSFPRHMEQPLLSSRRDLIKKKCAELGMEFVEAEAPDPTSDAGVAGAQQFILADVPKLVAKYGADTAFFATNCSMQMPLIKAVVEQKAFYPQPCCPSPYHGFPYALNVGLNEYGYPDLNVPGPEKIISETAEILREYGMLGRVSTWRVPFSMMATNTGVEYAIKWLNGEVSQEGIDVAALKQLLEDYAGVECYLSPYSEGGVEYGNYFLVREECFTYAETDIQNGAQNLERLGADGEFWVMGGNLIRYTGNAAEVVIPGKVTSIGYSAFSDYSSLKSVIIPDGVTSIGGVAFSGCSSLKSVIIPDGVTSIGDGAFSGCRSLQSVIIPNSVTSIDDRAFSGCSSLQSITIPNSVISIGYRAFSDCSNLQSAIIPRSVTLIYGWAFRYCDNLTIHCQAGSAAERYAQEDGIPYIIE